jgi:hypothetical protein
VGANSWLIPSTCTCFHGYFRWISMSNILIIIEYGEGYVV